jgi:hypothetical protein
MQPRTPIYLLVFVFVALCVFAASCSSGVNPGDESPTLCVVGSDCEQTLLLQCECCDKTLVTECKETTTAACVAGELAVVLSVNECQINNDSWALSLSHGNNPCDLFVEARLEYLCPYDNVPKDPCDPNPCLNKASCATGEDGAALCTCTEGFEGDLCENAIAPDLCDPSPCLNKATCSTGDDGAALCTCTDGFEGDLCENAIASDPCEPNPCQNDGTCGLGDDGEAVCTCTEGFEGDTCEIVSTPTACEGDYSTDYGPSCCNEFNEDPQGGGLAECVDGEWVCSEGQLCTCNDQPATTNCVSACDGQEASPLVCVYGDHWECMNQTPFFSTEPLNPCQNDGICSANDKGAALCACPDGFEGDFCETVTPVPCEGVYPNDSAPGCCSEADKDQPDNGKAACVDGAWTCTEGIVCTCKDEVAGVACVDDCDSLNTSFPTCVYADHWECMLPFTMSAAGCLPTNSG